MDTTLAEQKLQKLISDIRSLETVAVAFSGGVDSTFLLKVCHEAIGDKAVALTVTSSFVPGRESTEALEFCENLGVKHIVSKVDELSIPEFTKNPADRCYYCKKEIFSQMINSSGELGISYVLEGSNIDDDSDYRPGHRAIKELGVLSPLRQAGLTKEEIRYLSKKMNLPTWDKPSFACLASRFPYGEEITKEKLSMVEKSEDLLLSIGFKQFRVRIHGNLARIEVLPEQFEMMIKNKEMIYSELKRYGFSYVTMDLKGYRTGSMNETLSLKE